MKGIWVLLVGALVAVLPVTSEAQLFVETFDSYAAGSNVFGQGGWTDWDGSGNYGSIVSTAQSHSAPNSLLVVNPSDTVHTFSGVTSGTWYIKAWVYLPSTSTGDVYFIVLNTFGGTNNWSAQLRMCAAAPCTGGTPGQIVNVGGTGNPLTGTATLITNQWVEIRIEVNLDTNQATYYYNNTLLEGPVAWQVGGANEIQAFDLFSDGCTESYMDDIWLDTTIPVGLQSFSAE